MSRLTNLLTLVALILLSACADKPDVAPSMTSLKFPVLILTDDVSEDIESLRFMIAKRVELNSMYEFKDDNNTKNKDIFIEVDVEAGPAPYAIAGVHVNYRSYNKDINSYVRVDYPIEYSQCASGRGMRIKMLQYEDKPKVVLVDEVQEDLNSTEPDEVEYSTLTSEMIDNLEDSRYASKTMDAIMLDALYLHDPYTVLRDRVAHKR